MRSVFGATSRRLATAAAEPTGEGSLAKILVHGVIPRTVTGAFLFGGIYMLIQHGERSDRTRPPHTLKPLPDHLYLPVCMISHATACNIDHFARHLLTLAAS
jgi:hypothetical protein